MSIERIIAWFEKAIPTPTQRSFNVQLGVHIEEISEMFDTLSGDDTESDSRIKEASAIITALADDIKSGNVKVGVSDKVELLDSLCDQIVTASGIAHMSNMDMLSALNEVAASNDSKFDKNGMPIFNEHGKIMKGPNYFKPELAKYLR